MMSSLANDNHTCIFAVMSCTPHCKANFNFSGKDLILSLVLIECFFLFSDREVRLNPSTVQVITINYNDLFVGTSRQKII